MKLVSPNITVQTYRLLLYYRRKMLLITAGVVFLTLLFSAIKALLNPVYIASTSITTLPRRSEIEYAMRSTDIPLISPANFLSQTHSEFLLSRTVAARALEILEKDTVPPAGFSLSRFLHEHLILPAQIHVLGPIRGLLLHGVWKTIDPREAAIDGLKNRIKIRQIPGSYILELSVRDNNPDLAAKIANLLTSIYMDMTRSANQEEMRLMRTHLEEKIAETEKELAEIEQNLIDFKKTNHMYMGTSDTSIKMQELSSYIQDLSRTEIDLERMDSRITELGPFRTKGSMAGLKAERASLEAKKSSLEKIITETTATLNTFPQHERTYVRLLRDRMDKERGLSELRVNVLTTKAAEASKLSTIRIIDPAVPPAFPAKPNIIFNVFTAFIVGLFLSGGYMVGIESCRKHLRTADQLQEAGHPVLGPLPYLPRWRFPDIDAHPLSRFDKTAFRILTFLSRFLPVESPSQIRRMFDNHIHHILETLLHSARGKIVLLTSVYPGAGKTFLAKCLAEQAHHAGMKVLLIDANVAHPVLHEEIQAKPGVGISDLLMGLAPAAQVVQHLSESVDFIPAGTAWQNNVGKWHSETIIPPFKAFVSRYDLVLMESASLAEASHAAGLWRLADTLLLVFDADTTTQESLPNLQRRLEAYHGQVAGVLTKVKYTGDYLFHA